MTLSHILKTNFHEQNIAFFTFCVKVEHFGCLETCFQVNSPPVKSVRSHLRAPHCPGLHFSRALFNQDIGGGEITALFILKVDDLYFFQIRPYVNGALYSILAIPSIREEAKAMVSKFYNF